ncbi:uncharacterized protein LOC105446499 [Strongylocentrotus purpuratus]|uniref:Uncharacterized protein n=1 Tax=Strongylocentrotus purpuratus TaxID=7668 RepID=A0A7M7PD07_STRPU|nr:uncharacterized protein LOC105446499 [Strongylocentrotus purpuratus]
MRGLGRLIREQTKNLQWLCLSRVKGTDEEDLVELVECCIHVKTMNHLMLLGCGTNSDDRLSLHITGLNKSEKSLRVIALHDNGQLLVEKCQLSTEMTARLWSCLRSFTSLNHLSISESSLSFPPFLRELPSVTKLSAESVTSQNYEGLLSSLPGFRDIDITTDDPERDIPQITACLRRTGRQQLTHIDLRAPSSLPSEKNSVSRETISGLGLLIREQTKNLQWLCLSRVKVTDEGDLVDLVECCKHVKMMNHLMLLGCGTKSDGRLRHHITGLNKSEKSLRVIALHDNGQLLLEKCQLSTEMTARLLSCLRSYTSLNHLSISDSSLSFPPSPPELPSVTKISEKQSVSRETMRGLGLLIREKTKNLQWLRLNDVKCTDEEDLVYLIECCRHVKTMSELMFNSRNA